MRWLQGILRSDLPANCMLPNVQPKNMIIMDNASYHSRGIVILHLSNVGWRKECRSSFRQRGWTSPRKYSEQKIFDIIQRQNSSAQYIVDSWATASAGKNWSGMWGTKLKITTVLLMVCTNSTLDGLLFSLEVSQTVTQPIQMTLAVFMTLMMEAVQMETLAVILTTVYTAIKIRRQVLFLFPPGFSKSHLFSQKFLPALPVNYQYIMLVLKE